MRRGLERHKAAYEMRRAGMKLRHIGDIMGVSVERVRQMAYRYERELKRPHHFSDIFSVRLQNVIKTEGLNEQELQARLLDGSVKNIPNLGKASIEELKKHYESLGVTQ